MAEDALDRAPIEQEKAARKYTNEANLPAEPSSPETEARVSRTDEFARWPGNHKATADEGPKTARCRDSSQVARLVRTGRFERGDRLLRPRDFKRLSRVGERAASRCFVVLMAVSEKTDENGKSRLGMMVGRRVGNAVVRNQVKRAVREWFRGRRGRLERSVDLVVIARRGAGELSSVEVAEILDEIVFLRGRG